VEGWAGEWERFVRDESLFLAIFSFLPPIRKKREAATRAFLLARGRPSEEIDRDRISEAFLRELRELAAAEEEARRHRDEKAAEIGRLEEKVSRLEAHLKFFGIDAGGGAFSLRRLLEEIDKKGRSRAFYLACHYWEAQYLLEPRGETGLGG